MQEAPAHTGIGLLRSTATGLLNRQCPTKQPLTAEPTESVEKGRFVRQHATRTVLKKFSLAASGIRPPRASSVGCVAGREGAHCSSCVPRLEPPRGGVTGWAGVRLVVRGVCAPLSCCPRGVASRRCLATLPRDVASRRCLAALPSGVADNCEVWEPRGRTSGRKAGAPEDAASVRTSPGTGRLRHFLHV